MLSLRLHAAYVAELAASLHSGAVRLGQHDVRDATTQLTLSQTMTELQQGELLAQLAALRNMAQSGVAVASTSGSGPILPVPQQPASGAGDSNQALLAAATDLLSAQRPAVTKLLEQGPLDERLVPFAIPLLQYTALVEPMTAALQVLAPRIVGQLGDALLDPTQSAATRRRIPRILKDAAHARAAQALTEALRDPERDVRHRAATALSQLTTNRPQFAPERALIFELVRAELRAQHEERFDLSLVFALLSLALERAALRLARRALSSGDARQRGTALEYLHNVLPEPLRGELMTWLDPNPARKPPT
jgi:hypothetical protein